MIGIVYFIIIILANTVGAISGMGGGVLIKPIFDFIGVHSVAAISFYSSVAVLTMSLVSTTRQLMSGRQFNWRIISGVSLGGILGGLLGNIVFDSLLKLLTNEATQLLQIGLTLISLLFAFLYATYDWRSFQLVNIYWYFFCGLILGFLASLLGIGGGPINVSLLMLMFSLPIKEATVYSICTILFSQLAKITNIYLLKTYVHFDLTVLSYIIPAAIIGGVLGAKFSNSLSQQKVKMFFKWVIIIVLLINLYNGFKLL